MSDGCRLAARIWLPEDADSDPVPGILEYIPYRKNEATAARDALRHPYFAGHGYASVRVDMRGSGDSEGLLVDEYLEQEQDDGLEILSWIAAQPWCTGGVGIIGKSWGGFNGLQIAARRPPELKAVISVCSTDDRYADDVHYMGGCLLASDMLSWASTMLAFNARPPDPAVVGERWRELWLERLERTPPFVEEWLAHQRRDAYWKHGSVCESYAAIECPVYMVGGWADPYRNAILRFLEGYPGPRKGLIGPWSHNYPDEGVPGPAIGFLQECLRWWDRWLKDVETGIMDEPMLRVWMQDAVTPRTSYELRPGRWVTETSWPSPNVSVASYALGSGLDLSQDSGSERAGQDPPLQISGAVRAGSDAGAWIPFGHPGELPSDQRSEDGLSLAFTSAPLEAPVGILGFPEVTLALASDRPRALVAVRLCDVAPNGASTLVTRGFLNLTHRESHEEPAALEPGTRYTVAVRLNALAYSVPVGHCLRVAVSPAYWPWVWPSPEPVTLTVFTGGQSRLALPVRRAPAGEEEPSPFEEPEVAEPLEIQVLRNGQSGRTLRRDLETGLVELTVDLDYFGSRLLLRSGLEYHESGRDTFTILEAEPLSAETRSEWTIAVGRGEWQTRIETASTLSADAREFRVTNTVDAYEGNVRVFARTRAFNVPRDLI